MENTLYNHAKLATRSKKHSMRNPWLGLAFERRWKQTRPAWEAVVDIFLVFALVFYATEDVTASVTADSMFLGVFVGIWLVLANTTGFLEKLCYA